MIRFDNDPAADAAYKEILRRSVLSRVIHVEINGTELGSEKIIADSLNIKSAVMDSETLRFGGCISSQLTIRLQYINPSGLQGEKIRVWLVQKSAGAPLYPSDTLYPSESLQIGTPEYTNTQMLYTGYIESIRRLEPCFVLELIAYDEFYRMSQTKCKDALSLTMSHSPDAVNTLIKFVEKTLELYDSSTHGQTDYSQQLSTNRGFQYALSPLLSVVNKNLFDQYADDELTVLDVLAAHSELNARFAWIAADGSLRFSQFFVESLNAASKRAVDEAVPYYRKLSFEEKDTAQVLYLSFPYKDNNGREDRAIYGMTDEKRNWYVSDNIITSWCNSSPVAYQLVTNFWRNGTKKNYVFNAMSQYRSYELTTFGEWWLEPGDRITATAAVYDSSTGTYSNEQIDSFVLERELSGTSNMKVTIRARGAEYLGKEILQNGTVQ